MDQWATLAKYAELFSCSAAQLLSYLPSSLLESFNSGWTGRTNYKQLLARAMVGKAACTSRLFTHKMQRYTLCLQAGIAVRGQAGQESLVAQLTSSSWAGCAHGSWALALLRACFYALLRLPNAASTMLSSSAAPHPGLECQSRDGLVWGRSTSLRRRA